MSCRVSVPGLRLRSVFWLWNFVLRIAKSGRQCKEPKKQLVYYIGFVRDICFRWFYMSKWVKNDVMQGFCSWLSVAEVCLAVNFSFMYSREWSQVQETEEHLGYYIRVAPDIGFRWFYVSKWVKMMTCRVSAAGSRLRKVFRPLNLVLCIAESGHKCKKPKNILDTTSGWPATTVFGGFICQNV